MELTIPIEKDALVERCRQGDRLAFGELYAKYSRAMYNTSLRIVNQTADAEDVLQESFVDAFQSIESFGYKSTFGAWLKRIVVNKSINCLRKRRLDLVDIEKTNAEAAPDEPGVDEKELVLRVAEVKRAIADMPNGYRTVLTLYLFEGYDHEEIAEVLGVTHSTVRTQYMRAKQRLTARLKATP